MRLTLVLKVTRTQARDLGQTEEDLGCREGSWSSGRQARGTVRGQGSMSRLLFFSHQDDDFSFVRKLTAYALLKAFSPSVFLLSLSFASPSFLSFFSFLSKAFSLTTFVTFLSFSSD
jgi:hypothetical protein